MYRKTIGYDSVWGWCSFVRCLCYATISLKKSKSKNKQNKDCEIFITASKINPSAYFTAIKLIRTG